MYVWKTVKIFISSTFKDLELERDRLAEIFRNLQQKFYDRKIAIVPYDLRWRQKHKEEDLVNWCLEKIDECQYFVGILGHRYGWRPQKEAQGKVNTQRLSITAMEIHHSQNTIDENKRFYLLENQERDDVNESAEDLQSIKKLKQTLRDQNEQVFSYESSKTILETIENELEKRLERDYPQKMNFQVSSMSESREDIINEKVKGFVGREQYLKELRTFSQNETKQNYMCVRAVAGTGKSALLAYFIQELRQKNIPVIWHYMSMGGTNTAQTNKILESLAEQLQELQILNHDIDENDLRGSITNALEKSKNKIIVCIDGLDEAQGKALELHWLPRNLPKNIRVVLTTRPVNPWPKISQISNLKTTELPPLEENEIESLIDYYQDNHNCELDHADKLVLKKRAAGSPLFLKVAFDEMLSSGMAVGQLAQSVDKLFEQVLERLENKYGQDLIEKYLGSIAASRSGLSESELEEVLFYESSQQSVSGDLTLIIQKSLANFITRRNHLFTFFHPEFERTVKMRLGKVKLRHYHQFLAKYLQSKGFEYERTQYELPYQLQWGERYSSLVELLSNVNFLEHKANMMEDLAQDFQRILFEKSVPVPRELKVKNCFLFNSDLTLISDLYRIVQLYLPFLRRNPQTLFQTAWNLGYWTEKNSSIHLFVEAWRQKKEQEKHIWIRSLKPPQNLLHSPLEKNLRFHFGRINDIAFSPDGETMVSTGGLYDMKLRVWDVASGECFQILAGHQAAVSKARYTFNGKQIISSGRDGLIKIWDAKSGECYETIDQSPNKIECLDVNEKLWVCAGREDNAISIFSIESRNKIKSLYGHEDWVKSVAFHPTKKLLVSGSRDKTVRIWNLESNEEIAQFTHDAEVWSVVFHPTENKVISSSRDKSIRIWNLDDNICEKTLLGHTVGGVNDIDISPCGNYLASGGEDKHIRVWNFHSGECISVLHGHQARLHGVSFSPKGKYLASCSKDKSVCLWNLKKKATLKQNDEHQDKISEINWQKPHYFLSASWDSTVKMWKENGELAKTFKVDSGRVNSLIYDKDSEKIIAAGNDRNIYIWNSNNTKIIHSKHKSGITSLSLSKNKKYLISSSRDKFIHLWDLDSGERLQRYSGHEDWVQKALFHPNNSQIASCSKDTTIRIWSVDSGECLFALREHKKWVRDIDYSPDGKYIVSVSGDCRICIWDSTTGKCLHNIYGHRRNIQSVRFCQDGSSIVTWGWDGMVKIWDVKTLKCIKEMHGKIHIDHVFDESTSYLASSSNLRTDIIDRKNGKIIAHWPQNIDLICMNSNNVITGSTGSGYLPILQMCSG
ncbi:DUF4062 domain-containing protein [Candidatus Uabimicrobium sp. HlEnr_7]|uniref:WD40 domain-containing protein n=1 Tax=Candidatus Uabimicrobium helgolandensis TaxID=3095367 RepID=UPI003555F9C0